MGFGKILGLAALGVGAIAAAPFTGGGSILAATAAGASLAGAGTIAAAATAGAVGAAAGVAMSRKEEEEENKRNEEVAKLNKKAEKYEAAFKKAISEFQGDKEYFNYIIASTAIGMAVANADGEIADEELLEINEFVGGVASSNYPQHVKTSITTLRDNPPTFNESIRYLEKVKSSNYESIKDLIEIVIEADGKIHEKEQAFLEAFNSAIKMIEYTPEDNDNDNTFVSETLERLSA